MPGKPAEPRGLCGSAERSVRHEITLGPPNVWNAKSQRLKASGERSQHLMRSYDRRPAESRKLSHADAHNAFVRWILLLIAIAFLLNIFVR